MTSSSPLVIVQETKAQRPVRFAQPPAEREAQRLDPEFDHARKLRDEARDLSTDAVRKICDYAAEIERLRVAFLQPAGLRRGSEAQGVLQKNEGGFQAQLETQLGLHHEQAKRIIDRGRYMAMLRNAAAGKTIKYVTGTGAERKEKTFSPDSEARQCAQQALDAVMAGDVKPSAAWAGVIGESRRVAKTGKKERAAIDHAANLSNAVAKFKTSLPHWRQIPPGERAFIENEFNAIKPLLEGTLL